jgi:hypothetical protein
VHSYSVATIKRYRKPSGRVPREGTKIRAVYDLFYANKGKLVPFNSSRNAHYCLIQLTDIYGLDIRRIRKCTFCLVGEWFGRVYVDYTQQENIK